MPVLVQLATILQQVDHPAMTQLNRLRNLSANPDDPPETQWNQTIAFMLKTNIHKEKSPSTNSDLSTYSSLNNPL
jgi:hypothetical protein